MMSCTLNKEAWEKLTNEDIEWLDKQPDTLECKHIREILEWVKVHRLDKSEERIKELEAELEDYHNTEKFVLSEDCPTDENHCGCVVILKKRIKDQNDQIRKLSHDLSCTDLY